MKNNNKATLKWRHCIPNHNIVQQFTCEKCTRNRETGSTANARSI